jgi:hypothetical protein
MRGEHQCNNGSTWRIQDAFELVLDVSFGNSMRMSIGPSLASGISIGLAIESASIQADMQTMLLHLAPNVCVLWTLCQLDQDH